MARKMRTEVTEKKNADRDEKVKALKAGSFLSVGVPLPSLTPPGTVVDVAKATVATSVPTTKEDWEVLVSHSRSLMMSSMCVFKNMSTAVLPSLFWRTKKFGGTEFLTNCIEANYILDVKPTTSFLGKSLQISLCWYRDVRTARKMSTEVTEKKSADRDEKVEGVEGWLVLERWCPFASFDAARHSGLRGEGNGCNECRDNQGGLGGVG
ncbi:hypothetical protein F0562_021223 [Nyssa sinensis]|uniref:Uncharacterized protein n=1 Tax=Nyssa sinensis TaxID=561372 RepID=A0A5J5BNK6_9ASTE|nr:hypothetical protein F0562_021223 [Nyssa sinensis]